MHWRSLSYLFPHAEKRGENGEISVLEDAVFHFKPE